MEAGNCPTVRFENGKIQFRKRQKKIQMTSSESGFRQTHGTAPEHCFSCWIAELGPYPSCSKDFRVHTACCRTSVEVGTRTPKRSGSLLVTFIKPRWGSEHGMPKIQNTFHKGHNSVSKMINSRFWGPPAAVSRKLFYRYFGVIENFSPGEKISPNGQVKNFPREPPPPVCGSEKQLNITLHSEQVI